jgi:hypothetical protein
MSDMSAHIADLRPAFWLGRRTQLWMEVTSYPVAVFRWENPWPL